MVVVCIFMALLVHSQLLQHFLSSSGSLQMEKDDKGSTLIRIGVSG